MEHGPPIMLCGLAKDFVDIVKTTSQLIESEDR